MRILKKSVIISLLKGLVVEGEEVFHQDILGSNVMLTDENGDWIEKTLFGPFGNIISEQKTLLTSNIDHLSSNYNFTGKERDSESNLDYFGARYLDYNNGRWMKPDIVKGLIAFEGKNTPGNMVGVNEEILNYLSKNPTATIQAAVEYVKENSNNIAAGNLKYYGDPNLTYQNILDAIEAAKFSEECWDKFNRYY